MRGAWPGAATDAGTAVLGRSLAPAETGGAAGTSFAIGFAGKGRNVKQIAPGILYFPCEISS